MDNLSNERDKTQKEKEYSYEMFNRISKRYDMLNGVFSFYQDKRWRKRLLAYMGSTGNQRILDLGTGTGDVTMSLLKKGGDKKIKQALGCDMAFNMLKKAREKTRKRGLEARISYLQGDAACIPFIGETFDTVTMAFGIRNVVDPLTVLGEMHRVLKNQGKALVLEFSLPVNRLVRGVHLFYLRTIIPILGGMISGDRRAYRYLDETIESFPFGEAFSDIMRRAGFKNVRFYPLTLGVVTIYEGEK